MNKGFEFNAFQISQSPLEEGNPGFTLFGHAGDCHPHLLLLPRNAKETKLANKITLEILAKVIKLKGSIASEHGLGKKKFDNKPALIFQYGEKGYAEVRAMKIALDPDMRICPNYLDS